MPYRLSILALLLLSTLAPASDWPQWLGPNRDGTSTQKVLPWKEAPGIVWRQPVGEGNSGPIVAGGRVFLHAKKNNTLEEVIAFDAETGKELWRSSYPRTKFDSLFGNGPRATPVVAGDKLYTFGITGVLTCFDAAAGKQLWQVDTLKKFQAANLFFGVSCSPLVEGNKVLVNVGGKGASVVAFDKDKGDVLWQVLDDRASYAAPIAITQAGQRQIIFLTQQGLVSLKPDDGSVFWKFPLVDKLSESSTTPVRMGDLLLASSVTYGSVGLRLEENERRPAMSEAWKNKELTCYFSTPVPVGEHVYIVIGKAALPPMAQADLVCAEVKSGKVVWRRPKIGEYHASFIRTADNKLLMLDDHGNLILLEPSSKEYRELARSKVCGKTWAHPALAGGRLYVRDNKEVICVQMKDSAD